MAFTQGRKKGTAKNTFAEYVDRTFPKSKLDQAREKLAKEDPLSHDHARLVISIEKLKDRCMRDLVVGVYAEEWGSAMQQVHNLRNIFTLEWQMEMRNGKKR